MSTLSFIMIGLGVFIGIITIFFKKWVYNEKKAFKMALICVMVGLGTLIASMFLDNLHQYKMWIILLGSVFLWVSYTAIRDVKCCNEKVYAVCTKINSYSGGRGSVTNCPVFQYSYMGKEYLQQTVQGLRKLDDVQVGNTYPVYIWAKNPDHVILYKNVRFMDVFCGVLGLLFIVTAICLTV